MPYNKRMQLDKVPTTRAALVSELGRSQTLVVNFSVSASRPEVFSQAVLSILSLLSKGDPRRSRALRYRDSSYATPVCQQR